MVSPNQPEHPDQNPWEKSYGNQPPQYPPPNPSSYPPPPNYAAQPPGYPGQPGYGGQPGYPANQPYPSPGNLGYPVDPQAPYGRDPATGNPLSDKSATTAGLLQLFFGVFGVGRFYLESTQIAVIQLCLGLAGFVLTIFCGIGIFLLFGVGVWALVDAIMIFSGSVQDNYGRKLR